MATEKILNDGLRAKYTDVIREALAQAGYDVLQVGTNELCIPALDADRNDKYVTFTVKVPTGERGGDPYDGYSMAEDFALKQKAKAEKAKEKEATKQKKMARDAANRAKENSAKEEEC